MAKIQDIPFRPSVYEPGGVRIGTREFRLRYEIGLDAFQVCTSGHKPITIPDSLSGRFVMQRILSEFPQARAF